MPQAVQSRRIGEYHLVHRCPQRRGNWGLGKFCLVLVASILSLQPAAAAANKQVRRVLVFNNFDPWAPVGQLLNQQMLAAFQKSPYEIEYYVENLDTTLFPDEASQRQIEQWYFLKYHDRKPDVIVAVGAAAIKFMAASHNGFAPDVPIVFWGASRTNGDPPKLDSDFTGVWVTVAPEATLQAALHLQPDTKHVVVVGGVSGYDSYLERLVKERFRSYESKIDFTYLTNLDMPALLERLRHLPSHTVVYYTSLTEDAAGKHYVDAKQAVPLVASAASAPVFVLDESDVGAGTVGGDVFSYAASGGQVAGTVLRVLNGEKPRDIPLVRASTFYKFDWRALQRWGIKESDLPANSIVLNRQPTFWELYKRYALAGISLILIETLLILGLLWQRAKMRKVETSLAASNEELKKSEAGLRESEAHLQVLSGRLITAQEEERTRIARDLHDDLGSRLAVLQVRLTQCKQLTAEHSPELAHELTNILEVTKELASTIHNLSHQLYPPKLEILGLIPALQSLCKEFSEHDHLRVHFVHHGIHGEMPKDVTLCVFRIVQEALHNVAKHSGATEANVELGLHDDGINLSISDRGKGFDPASATASAGLGLLSMRERLRLVGGKLAIESQPSQGTQVRVHIPLRTANSEITSEG